MVEKSTYLPARPAELKLPGGQDARAGWTLTPSKRHLNHGSYGAVPAAGQKFQNELRREMDADPCEWFMTLGPRIEAARNSTAGFLGITDSDALSFVPNASAGASTVYGSVALPEGSEVLVTNHGYGAVRMGAARWARRHGATVRTLGIPVGASDAEILEAFREEMNDATSAIVVDQVTSATARQFPVDGIVTLAKERGVITVVDGAHSPGVLETPYPVSKPTFWIGNLHKFACSPRGAAVLVADTESRDQLFPIIDSWGSPDPYPSRFDQQGSLDMTSYLAAPYVADWVETNFGWSRVIDYSRTLMDYATQVVGDALSKEGGGGDYIVDVGSPVGSMRLFELPAGLVTSRNQAHHLRAEIARLGFEVAITDLGPTGYLRLSAHAYNTASDYEAFAEQVVPLLSRGTIFNQIA